MPLISQDWPRWKVLTPVNTDQECIDTATFESLQTGNFKFWISHFAEGTTKKMKFEILGDRIRFDAIEGSPFKLIEPGSIYEDFLTEARNLAKTFPLETTDILHIEGPRPYISDWIQGDMKSGDCHFIKFFRNGEKDYLYQIIAPTIRSSMEIYNLKLFEYTKSSINFVYIRIRLKMLNRDTESIKFINRPASSDDTDSIKKNFAPNEYVVSRLPVLFAGTKGKSKPDRNKLAKQAER
jgi:hypothetical protein